MRCLVLKTQKTIVTICWSFPEHTVKYQSACRCFIKLISISCKDRVENVHWSSYKLVFIVLTAGNLWCHGKIDKRIVEFEFLFVWQMKSVGFLLNGEAATSKVDSMKFPFGKMLSLPKELVLNAVMTTSSSIIREYTSRIFGFVCSLIRHACKHYIRTVCSFWINWNLL